MRDIGKIVGKGLLVLLAGTFIATILLTLAYMLPINEKNRASTYTMLAEEGRYTRAVVSGERYENHYNSFLMPDGLDSATDAVMLYTAFDNSSGDPLKRAMEAYNLEGGGYTYYWHGYVSLLRPLMLLFDYKEFRVVNCAIQLLLVFSLVFLIGREKGMRYVIMFLTSYMLLMPVALPLSLQFSWIFYVAYAGLLILLWKRDYFAIRSRYIFFFMAMGMAACYFDLLTYPLFTWGFPLVWWLVMDPAERKESVWVREVIFSGISWIVGYAGLWIMKWTLATVVLGRNIFESAINEVFFRSGMQGDGSLEERFQAIYINWKHYQYKVYAWILAVWLIWWICRPLYLGGSRRDTKRYAYLLIGLSSVVWYFVLSNHTRGHNYFTYRIFGVSILAFLAMVLGSVSGVRKPRRVPLRRRLVLAGALLLVMAVSVPLGRTAREELSVLNGQAQFRRISMAKDEFLETSFSPTFGEIRGFNIGLESSGETGYCEVSLWRGDTLEYQEIYQVEKFGESNYQRRDVKWKLNPRETYRLTVEIKETEQPVYVWVTDNGEMPLAEYGGLSVNGEPESGQLLTGISYWGMPALREARLFLTMTWVGILSAIGYTLWPLNKKINIFLEE
ncbi:MAG: hypothetical protein J1E64_02530 [Acetatifactor sp.]|nr:hypothetical protein [Acetatifactor sp.]